MMGGLHKELSFENEICDTLAAQGWLYAEGDAKQYDRARALFPADVIAWVQETQPKAWEALCKSRGASEEAELLDRVRKSLDDRGTLDVLRYGVELLGLRQELQLAQFKPALAMNIDTIAKYQKNRLRVVRQLHYSLHNENSIDFVLFLNGFAVATVELKTDFTQSVDDAVDQYRFDRNPNGRSGFIPTAGRRVETRPAWFTDGTMSKQALDSERVRSGLEDVLLGPAQLYEALRDQGSATHL